MDATTVDPLLEVSYLELRRAPAAPRARDGSERIVAERLDRGTYLALYRRVGGPVGWDQRLKLAAAELDALLASPQHRVYVLRDARGEALGFCEFDSTDFPEIELKNFGLVREAQGRGLGPWLLAHGLHAEWQAGPMRIWLHTDAWDHPAAIPVYRHAGFEVYAVRHEPADLL